MYRVDTSTAAASLPAPGATGDQGYFQSGNPLAGTPATVPGADWFNAVQEELMNVVVQGGLVPDKIDRTQVFTAIQNLVLSLGGGALLPIFPLVETSDNKLSVLAGSGAVAVATGQTFIWRGSRRMDTSDYLEADRTFAIVANTTYHLRWTQSGGFVLNNVTDIVYNPSALPETDQSFDSTYDDLLVARVVTDGANSPTIASLRNAAILRGRMEGTTSSVIHDGLRTWSLDWARSPDWSRSWSVTKGDDAHHMVQTLEVTSATRYGIHHKASYLLQSGGFNGLSDGFGDSNYDLTAEA